MWCLPKSTVVWRDLVRFLSPPQRRRSVSFKLATECLESRQLLSAVAAASNEPVANAVEKVSGEAVAHHARKRTGFLTGQWAIDTPAGPLQIESEQRGKRVRGKADLADFDVGSLLNLPIPLPIPIEISPVTFKGKFKNLTLDVDFETQIALPIIGTPLFQVTGHITAQVQLGTGLVGHLTVNVNGNQVLSTDFTTPLPTLP